jgi:hypothetical protein
LQIDELLAGEHALPPLIESGLLRLFPGRRVGERDLQEHRFVLSSAFTERRQDRSHTFTIRCNRDQGIGPSTHPTRSVRAQRRPDDHRRNLRPVVKGGPGDAYRTFGSDCFPRPERAHDGDRCFQARMPRFPGRPRVAGDRFVERLTAADRQPEAPRVHLGQRGCCLRDDRRMVPLSRRANRAE